MRSTWLIYVILITCCASCRKQTPPAPAEQLEASSLSKITVKAKAKLLFTFAANGGAFESVTDLEKIPEDRLGWVRVVDLNIKPERRRDHELVYVADLRTPKKDGSYPYIVMSRGAFEAAASNRASQGAMDPPSKKAAPGGSSSVVLYSTSWCGACRSARDYLTKKGIPFIEKDIEKDPAAAAELLSKAKAAGISTSGVPVLDVKGTLMQGFSPQQLNKLLGEKS